MTDETDTVQRFDTPSLREPIALGRTAEIHAWGDGRVLKLFHTWVSEGMVTYEAEISRKIHASGLPVPAVGETVTIGDRHGLVYERITGTPMLDVLTHRPWLLIRYARLLADLHIGMHREPAIDGLPPQRERIANKIDRAKVLEPHLKRTALNALADLPDGGALCHGDFHPANILMTPRGPIIIDWPDATVGNPIADLARSSIIQLGASQSADDPWVSRLALAWYHRIYLRRYLKPNPGAADEYRKWLPVVAAARMSEGIANAQHWLHRQVREAFG